jgi:lipoprotein NlpI
VSLWFVSAIGVAAQRAEHPQVVLDQAVGDLEKGRIDEAVAGFDKLVTLVPGVEPQLWQREIALYFAGRYNECRAQSESHRSVNPNDVENAAWHFLCVARGESPDKAKAALLPVGRDGRVPMREIHEMFRGVLPPEDVLKAAGDSARARFYAHLYMGLYFEAIGNAPRALEHITASTDYRYALAGGYMHSIAVVHRDRLQRR